MGAVGPATETSGKASKYREIIKVRFLCKSVSLQINIQLSYLFCCFVVVCSCSKISETEDKKNIFSCRTLFPVNFVVQETKNPSTKDAPLEQNAVAAVHVVSTGDKVILCNSRHDVVVPPFSIIFRAFSVFYLQKESWSSSSWDYRICCRQKCFFQRATISHQGI